MNKKILIIIMGAIVLCFAGLNNKFPLLTESSGIYINSGFTKEAPSDRPLLYGIFVAHSSWGKSLWLTIFSQALMLSLVLFYYFQYFSNSRYHVVLFAAYIFFITFFTPVSVWVSSISPSIFLSIAVLSSGLMLFAKKLSRRDYLILAGVIVFSCGIDVSYMLIISSLILLISVIFLFTRKNKSLAKISSGKRLSEIIFFAVLGWLISTLLLFLTGGNASTVYELNVSMLQNLPGINADVYSAILDETETFKALFHRYNDDVREFYLSWQRFEFLNINIYFYSQVFVLLLCLCLFIYFRKHLTGTLSYCLFVYFSLACIILLLISITGGDITGFKNTLTWILSLPIYFYIFKAENIEIIKKYIKTIHIPDSKTSYINT